MMLYVTEVFDDDDDI